MFQVLATWECPVQISTPVLTGNVAKRGIFHPPTVLTLTKKTRPMCKNWRSSPSKNLDADETGTGVVNEPQVEQNALIYTPTQPKIFGESDKESQGGMVIISHQRAKQMLEQPVWTPASKALRNTLLDSIWGHYGVSNTPIWYYQVRSPHAMSPSSKLLPSPKSVTFGTKPSKRNLVQLKTRKRGLLFGTPRKNFDIIRPEWYCDSTQMHVKNRHTLRHALWLGAVSKPTRLNTSNCMTRSLPSSCCLFSLPLQLLIDKTLSL